MCIRDRFGLLLDYPNGPYHGCFDCLLRYGLDVECLEPQLVPDLPLCRWGNPNERMVDEGLLRYSPNFT